jgi:hypothetical protein
VAKNDTSRSGVEVHTPDSSKYHPGLTPYGTTIPSSTKGGASRGFDSEQPNLVVVDPDMEDGKVVDYSKFVKHKDLFNTKVNQVGGNDPESAFRAIVEAAADIEEAEKLSSATPAAPKPRLKEKTVMSKDQITLSPTLNESLAALPTVEGGSRGNGRVTGDIQRANDVSTGLSQQLAMQTEVLSQMVGVLANLRSPPSSSEAPADAGLPVQTVSQVQDEVHEEEVRDKVISGFETLEMSFVNGPLPVKPKKEVYFEMPNMGTMAARYHEIQDGGTCLALIYDTRYEDGYQFMPPALGDVRIKMTVPREEKTYYCSSVGIHFNCGVLDIVVLFKHTQDSEDTEENR